MAFPTGAVNEQVYTSKYGTRYVYQSDTNRWVKQGVLFYGSTGYVGLTGMPGLTGIQGDTGDQGDTGVQGITGIQGATGGPAEQGATGIAGETGGSAQGIQGYYGSATGSMSFVFDGNGGYLIPGTQISIKTPYRFDLSSWEVVTRETGFFSADISAGSYSDWPVLTKLNESDPGVYVQGGVKNHSVDLSGWTSVNVGGADYLQVQVSGVTGVMGASVSLGYYRY